MKHPLNPPFDPVWPPRWTDRRPGVPVLGQRRPNRIAVLVLMSFFGAPDLTIEINSPYEMRVAYRAALFYARLKHSTKRITELKIFHVYEETSPDVVALAEAAKSL